MSTSRDNLPAVEERRAGDDLAHVRHDIEQVQREVAGLGGRIDSVLGRLASTEDRVGKLTDLVTDVLQFSSAQIAEMRKSLDTTEEHLRAMRAGLVVATEQQGRMLRELAELRR